MTTPMYIKSKNVETSNNNHVKNMIAKSLRASVFSISMHSESFLKEPMGRAKSDEQSVKIPNKL